MAGFLDPDQEAAFDRAEAARRRYDEYRLAADPTLAKNVANMASAWGRAMAPGVVYSLGAAGLEVNGREVETVAKTAPVVAKKKGWFSRNVGQKISGAVAAAAGAVGEVAETGYDVFKGFSRGTFAGADFLAEVGVGGIRNAVQPGDQNLDDAIDQSTLGVAWDQLKDNDFSLQGLDFGSGFTMDGAVKKEQVRRARAAAPLVNGKAYTPGRALASLTPADPSSFWYNVISGAADATVTVALDPASLAAKPVSAAMKSRKLITGGANTVVESVETAAETAAKQKARVFGAGEATALEYAEDAIRFGSVNPRVSQLKADFDSGLITKTEMAQRLEKLRDQIKVDAGALKGGVRRTVVPEQAATWINSSAFAQTAEALVGETSFSKLRKMMPEAPAELIRDVALAGDSNTVKNAFLDRIADATLTEKVNLKKVRRPRPRWAERLPGQHLFIDDLDETVEMADRYMRNADLDDADVDEVLMAFASADGKPGTYQAFRTMTEKIKGKLVTEGTPKGAAEALTRVWEDYDKKARAYFLDSLGDEMSTNARINASGKLEELPSPHLANEYINGAIPLPNVRAIKRATASPIVKAMLDEEKRLGKLGSATQDIADFITNDVWTATRLLRGGFVIRNIAEAQLRIATAGYDGAFSDPLSYIGWIVGDNSGKLNKVMLGKVDRKGGVAVTGEDFVRRSQVANAADEWARAQSRNGGIFRTRSGKGTAVAPGYERVDKTRGREFTKAWVAEMTWVGNDNLGRAVLTQGPDAAKDWFYRGEGRRHLDELLQDERFVEKFGDTRQGADAYVDTVFERLRIKTGDVPEIQEMLRTGRLGKIPLYKGDGINPDIYKALEAEELFERAPEIVRGFKGSVRDAESRNRWRDFVDAGFELLASRPENYFNNDPLFRQAYWRKAAQLAGYLNAEDQATLLARATKDAKLDKDLLKQIEKNMKTRSGNVSLKDLDKVASQHGLRQQRKILYSSYDKMQGFDTLRAVFVFGDALKNTATTWTRLLAENPLAPVKFQQRYYEGAQDLDPNGDGKGFFYRDDQFGQERFALPFTDFITPGASDGFSAPVEGLNLLTQSVVPSLGPVTSILASKVIPNSADFDGVRKVLMPYGETDVSEARTYLPPWAHKAYVAMTSGGDGVKSKEFANTVGEVVRFKMSTGEYDLTDEDSIDDMLQDAKSDARKLFAVRGLVQFFAPSPPSPKFVQYDKDGKIWETFELSRIYREEFGGRDLQGFLEKYGQLAIGAAISKTETQGAGPVNQAALDFVRENPEVARKYQGVYGLFLSDDGPFNFPAYQRQLDNGERDVKSPEDFVAEIRSRMARTLYEAAKDQYGEDNKQALRTVREQLEVTFQFNNQAFTNTTKTKVNELVAAANDPVLANTRAGKALRLYLQARERAFAAAKERNIVNIATNGDAKDLKAYLAKVGEAATTEYPEFTQMWERVFAREVGVI